jgi:L-cysteine:1D-myo-inositol 2-amino-2-deoxy-alpha-D-glucopyranoside ligase
MDGEKMSKSLGNLVFVSELRKTWDTRAIRLAVLTHHYRTPWEWRDDLMAESAERLHRWQSAVTAGGDGEAGLEEARAALDDDLDTPGALRAIDEAAAAGKSVIAAAGLLGVRLAD